MRTPTAVFTLSAVLWFSIAAFSSETRKRHPDYVPDQKTAEKIGEAILIAKYGEERVNAQRPLLVGSNEQVWVVQGAIRHNGMPEKGSGLTVWIDKHSGCIEILVEHMK